MGKEFFLMRSVEALQKFGKPCVVCDAATGRVYENITNIASSLESAKRYGFKDAEIVARVDSEKRVIFEDHTGHDLDLGYHMKGDHLSSAERARVESAYIKRYGQKPRTAEPIFRITNNEPDLNLERVFGENIPERLRRETLLSEGAKPSSFGEKMEKLLGKGEAERGRS